MKLMADQDVYAITVRLLRESGHDVTTAAEVGMANSSDADLLETAHQEGRIFITRDRDFGSLIFVRALGGGVLYLRSLPTTMQAVHLELERVLRLDNEENLRGAFVVIEPGRHRIRRAIGQFDPNT